MTESAAVKLLLEEKAENGRLRIALWNELRRRGVQQDRAIQIIQDAISGAKPIKKLP